MIISFSNSLHAANEQGLRPELAVVDLGSRTTEFVTTVGGEYQWAEIATGYKVAWDSFYENAETFGKASAEHLQKLGELIGEKEKEILRRRKELRMVEVGETSAYILGISQNRVEGKVVTRLQVKGKLQELLGMNAESFAHLKRNFKDAANVAFLAVGVKRKESEETAGFGNIGGRVWEQSQSM